MYNILDFAVHSDSTIVWTRQIQAAIDHVAKLGGGTIYFPAGQYITGTVFLKSHVTLYLDAGCTILGSTDWHDYSTVLDHKCEFPANWRGFGCEPVGNPIYDEENKDEKSRFRALIAAEDAEDIGIIGQGTIDGQAIFGKQVPYPDNPQRKRPYLFLAYQCERIRIRDVSLKNPGFWVISCNKSRNIMIDGVNVDSWDSCNGDGLDFDGSSDVVISNCILRTGDDAISFKSYIADPCKNFTVNNCVISARWAAIRFGIDAMSETGNVVIQNCVFEDACDGIKIQSGMGADIHDVIISNIVMERVHRPIFMTISRSRLSVQCDSVRPTIGRMRGITLSNIRAKMCAEGEVLTQNLVAISGTPERKVEDVLLQNITIEYEGGGTEELAQRYCIPEFIDYGEFYAEPMQFKGELPTCGFYLRHIEELRMDNCRIVVRKPDGRPAVFAYGVDQLELRGVSVKGKTEGVLRAIQCGDVSMYDCRNNTESQNMPLPVNKQGLELLEEFKRMSWDCHVMFDRMAKLTDAAEKAEILMVLDKWETEESGLSAKTDIPQDARFLHFQMLYGNCSVYFNGNMIGDLEVPRTYRTKTMVTFEIPEQYRGKHVTIMLLWKDPNDRGGFEAKMPFGDDFTLSSPGLYDQVEIRG